VRFVVTGEWDRNRLLQTIVVLYCLYVGLLWITNALLYFDTMTLNPASVAAHYLGNEAQFTSQKSYRGLLEVSHFHLFAMGMLLLVLTHLALFVNLAPKWKAMLIIVPFCSAFLSEGASWLVRYGGAGFAWVKVLGFLMLQGSLAFLIVISLWSVFGGVQAMNYSAASDDEWDDGDDDADGEGPERDSGR
jgi:hypothetical protein